MRRLLVSAGVLVVGHGLGTDRRAQVSIENTFIVHIAVMASNILCRHGTLYTIYISCTVYDISFILGASRRPFYVGTSSFRSSAIGSKHDDEL